MLFEAGDTIKAVYFPITAVISLVVTLATGEPTEAAMVGRDGAVGSFAPAIYREAIAFTQEFLAEMLGVRRTSVTSVAHTLQEAGMIKYTRGRIEILDLEGLRDTACECYESTKEQYARLLGPSSSSL